MDKLVCELAGLISLILIKSAWLRLVLSSCTPMYLKFKSESGLGRKSGGPRQIASAVLLTLVKKRDLLRSTRRSFQPKGIESALNNSTFQ